MPDPYKWFTVKFHNYYRKCHVEYCSELDKQMNKDIIYYLNPLNSLFNINSIVDNFSNIIKTIFDNAENNLKRDEFSLDNNVILPKIYNGNLVAIYLKTPNDIIFSYLKEILLNVTSILEDKYNTYLLPYNFAIYRNFKLNNIPKTWEERIKYLKNDGAWIWHCDHDSPIKFKVFIYLNDIDEKRAPFEILFNKNKNSVIKMVPYGDGLWSWKLVEVKIDNSDEAPYFLKDLSKLKKFNINSNTRVPIETINELEKLGYEKIKITGKKGSIFAFQNNLVHTANFAEEEYRDVLVIEYIPSLFKINNNNFDEYFMKSKEELYKMFIK